MLKVLAIIGTVLLLLVIVAGLAITVLPHFLDRVYYRGPRSEHFDGQRFFNPDGDADTLETPTGGSRAGFLWRYLTKTDGRPPWPDQVAVTPTKPAPRVDGERMVVTWIGHATMLVQTQGLNILTDPIWANRAGPLGFGPTRTTEPGVRFDDLPTIDVVLVSHNHYDHLDQATLARLAARDHPRIVTSLGNDAVIGQPNTTALDWGGSTEVKPGVRVIATRAHHWGSRWFSDRNRALWSGFVVALPSGGNLFFSGDTGVGDGRWPAEAAAHGPIRLALLPIGAFRFVPGQMAIGSHMGPVDAVEMYRRTGAARGIAVHWGTFRLSYEGYDTPPKMLDAAMRCTGQTGFGAVEIGVPTEIAPYAAPKPAAEMPRAALLKCLDTPAVRALR